MNCPVCTLTGDYVLCDIHVYYADSGSDIQVNVNYGDYGANDVFKPLSNF